MRAFASGGVPGLPGTAALTDAATIQRMKETGDLDDFTVSVYIWVLYLVSRAQ